MVSEKAIDKAAHGKSNETVMYCQWKRPSNENILRGLYILMTFLCGFMVFWILIFPGSWMVGRFAFHDKLLHSVLSVEDGVVSSDSTLKYKGHSAVQLTHSLPGAFWAAAIPIQFHPMIRKHYRQFHRMIGYAFVTTTAVMMFGVVVIIQRGLLFENSFPDLPPEKHSSIPGLVMLSIWFIYTAVMAVFRARAKDFASHQRYMIRHVACGIWVSLQRLLLLTAFNRPSFTRLEQRAVFGKAAMVALVISVLCGELAIYLLKDERRTPGIIQSPEESTGIFNDASAIPTHTDYSVLRVHLTALEK